jgi:hypothetical protein
MPAGRWPAAISSSMAAPSAVKRSGDSRRAGGNRAMDRGLHLDARPAIPMPTCRRTSASGARSSVWARQPDADSAERLGRAWSLYRAYAVQYLWHSLGSARRNGRARRATQGAEEDGPDQALNNSGRSGGSSGGGRRTQIPDQLPPASDGQPMSRGRGKRRMGSDVSTPPPSPLGGSNGRTELPPVSPVTLKSESKW